MYIKNASKINTILSLVIIMATVGIALSFNPQSVSAKETTATPGCYFSTSEKVTESGDTYTKFTFTKVDCPKDSKSYYVTKSGASTTPDSGHCYVLNGSGAKPYGGGTLYDYVIPSTGKGYCSWMHDKLIATGRYVDKAVLVDATTGANSGGGPTGPTSFPADCENIGYASGHEDECDLTQSIVKVVVNVLSAAVGLVIIISIIIAGIQYTTANGNQQSVAAAKNRLTKAAVALALYIFGFGLLNWLIPGGLLK